MSRRITKSIVTLGIITLGLAMTIGAESENPSDSVVVDGHVHTPAELYKLLEKSPLVYELDVWQDSVMPQDTMTPVVLQSMIWPAIKDGKPVYTRQTLPDSVQTLMDLAEKAFKDKELDTALLLYRQVLQGAPRYLQTKTFIGDVFFLRSQYDSAAGFYQDVVRANPSDYQAHWFLGDALAKIGDTAGALREFTTAHILNVNHEKLKKSLISLRAASGKPWKEWEFKPRYIVRKDSTKIKVIGDEVFVFYALPKALWAYEPGYAEKMRDTSDIVDIIWNLREEREAVACVLSVVDSLRTNLLEPIGVDNFQQFVLYEVIAKRNPYLMLHLDEESRNLLVEYVSRFH